MSLKEIYDEIEEQRPVEPDYGENWGQVSPDSWESTFYN